MRRRVACCGPVGWAGIGPPAFIAAHGPWSAPAAAHTGTSAFRRNPLGRRRFDFYSSSHAATPLRQATQEPTMIDRLFTLILTFAVLVGGTLAVGSELFAPRATAQPDARIATLPRVVVTGHKQPARAEVARAESDRNDTAAKFTQ
jgi:hypothetical protein